MKRHFKTIVKAAIVLLIAGTAYYFWKLAPVSVPTFEVKSSSLVQTVFGTGTLEGKTRLAVSPRETTQSTQVRHVLRSLCFMVRPPIAPDGSQ